MPPPLSICQVRQVSHVYFTQHTPIQLPEVRCSDCGEQWWVRPEQIGCSPSSAAVSGVLFDDECAEVYSQLAHSDGVGAGAYCEAVARVERDALNLPSTAQLPQSNDK